MNSVNNKMFTPIKNTSTPLRFKESCYESPDAKQELLDSGLVKSKISFWEDLGTVKECKKVSLPTGKKMLTKAKRYWDSGVYSPTGFGSGIQFSNVDAAFTSTPLKERQTDISGINLLPSSSESWVEFENNLRINSITEQKSDEHQKSQNQFNDIVDNFSKMNDIKKYTDAIMNETDEIFEDAMNSSEQRIFTDIPFNESEEIFKTIDETSNTSEQQSYNEENSIHNDLPNIRSSTMNDLKVLLRQTVIPSVERVARGYYRDITLIGFVAEFFISLYMSPANCRQNGNNSA